MSIVQNRKTHFEVKPDNCKTFCELFKIQLKKTPEAIAAIFDDKFITYEELNTRSVKLAHFLNENGVSEGKIVGLCLYNSLDLIVGILGILKAGGVYLPIDPNYQSERVHSIINDANPEILITDESLKDRFQHFSKKIITLKDVKEPVSNIKIKRKKTNQIAYIVYTSGSTGKPKGIMVEHQALLYAIHAHQKLHNHNLCSLVCGSINFDASIMVISLTLATGGIVCIPPNNKYFDPRQIVKLIEEYKVNYMLCVPSFYSMLLNQSQKLSSLLSVDLGGENIPNDILENHKKLAPNSILYNIYGPSEYAIGATFEKIYDPITKEDHKITIGKPFSGTQVYILDGNFNKVSGDIKGEIFIAGEGLAKGYLNNDHLTKEKFIWLDIEKSKSIRFYRTGDFGRILSDGNIEFLGRMDHQVKIRGYRVELGEIEYTMRQIPEVTEAVVIAKEKSDGNLRLIAYFSSQIDETLIEKVKIYLGKVLPDYMVPSTFMQIRDWPLTSNGKIDRNSLPKPEMVQLPEAGQKSISELEKSLFQIWKEILHIETFSLTANFFDLGGDSLLLINMQIALERNLGFKVSTSDLLQHSSIAQLTTLLSKNSIEPKRLNHLHFANKQKSAYDRFKKAKRE